MKTTLLCLMQTTGATGAPRPIVVGFDTTFGFGTGLGTGTRLRPTTGYPTALAPIAAARAIAASWSAIVRKSMNVPSFHDRWPLSSST